MEGLVKLILAKRCGVIFNLRFTETTCGCGCSGGKYLSGADDNQAVYWGEAIPLSFSNAGLAEAVKAHKANGTGAQYFPAWVVGTDSDTFRRGEK